MKDQGMWSPPQAGGQGQSLERPEVHRVKRWANARVQRGRRSGRRRRRMRKRRQRRVDVRLRNGVRVRGKRRQCRAG